MARSLVVISAGLNQPSSTRLLADRLTAAATLRLDAAGAAATVRNVELRDHVQELTNNLLTGFPSPRLREVVDAVLGSDGLIAVSPIFNASYSGLFKLFFDVLEIDSLVGRPVLLGATGGTARHSLAIEHALRPLFAYLGAATVPTAVFAAAEDWGQSGDQADGALAARIGRAGGELAAAMASRQSATRVDPFEDPLSFAELIAGATAEPHESRDFG